MVSLLFHGKSGSEIERLRERLREAVKSHPGPPWSCREEALGDGRYRVTFVAAPACVRQLPLEGTSDEIAAELARRLAG